MKTVDIDYHRGQVGKIIDDLKSVRQDLRSGLTRSQDDEVPMEFRAIWKSLDLAQTALEKAESRLKSKDGGR